MIVVCPIRRSKYGVECESPAALTRPGHGNTEIAVMQLELTSGEGPNPSGLCMCGCGQRTELAANTRAEHGWVKGKPKRYLHGHAWNPSIGRTLAERFWSKVEKTSSCWLWRGATNASGYGLSWDPTRQRPKRAHRVSYELSVGPIPEGLVLDHLCRNPSCVNPAHLEPVTDRENILRGTGASAQNARKTHCPKGHPLEGDNLYRRPNQVSGRGQCLACIREAWAAKVVG
jgi:hypothetical protein